MSAPSRLPRLRFARLALVEQWQRSFLETLGVLCGVVLPILCLFRYASWSLYLSPWEILVDISLLFLLFALVALSISAGLALLSTVVFFLAGNIGMRLARAIDGTGLLLVGGFGALMLLRPIKLWFGEMLSEQARRWVTNLLSSAFQITVEGAALVGAVAMSIAIVMLLLRGPPQHPNQARQRLQLVGRGCTWAVMPAAVILATSSVGWFDFRAVRELDRRSEPPGTPNVILISVDTLTAADMSIYGYPLPTTPNLSKFAAHSYLFENFFAVSNFTTPTVASLLTGVYPHEHKAYQLAVSVAPDVRQRTLAESLKTQGYSTHAFVANAAAHPLALRIEKGFHEISEPKVPNKTFLSKLLSNLQPLSGTNVLSSLGDVFTPLAGLVSQISDDQDLQEGHPFPPELTFDAAQKALVSQRFPVFVWLHINPPHVPYLPGPDSKFRFEVSKTGAKLRDYQVLFSTYEPHEQEITDQLRRRYDEFILDTDRRLGRFFDTLEAAGRFDDSIIVLTADHGESFEKGRRFHGGPHLHQPLIHIPLLIHLPKQRVAARVRTYADQTDIVPTLHDLLGTPMPKGVTGESLKKPMLDGIITTQPKYAMTFERSSRFREPDKGTIAVMQKGWKFVRYLDSGIEELFELESDPHETTNLAAREPARVNQMRALVATRFNLSLSRVPGNRND